MNFTVCQEQKLTLAEFHKVFFKLFGNYIDPLSYGIMGVSL